MSETINPKKATDLFKEGVLAADAGENYTAEESFKNIHELGKSSSGTEYNLGVLYANESEYGKSIYHFHNAIFLNRFDKNYRESLAYVEKQVPNEFALIKNDYDHYLYQARSYVHAEEALLLSAVVLLFYFLGRSCLLYTSPSPRDNR